MNDVDALREHAVTQQYTFLVDSRDRDREAFPTPSEYVVTFDQPFRNVVGFEVIEATIPRTMYNLDVSNNVLYFFVHNGTVDITGTLTEADFVRVEVPTGDYSVGTLLPALNKLMKVEVDGRPVSLTVEAVSQPAEVKGLLRFRCPYPFVLDMKRSTISEVLGFDLYGPKLFKYTAMPAPQFKLFESSLVTTGDPVTTTLFNGPTAVSTFFVGTVAQRFVVQTPVTLRSFRLATYKNASSGVNPTMTYRIRNAVGDAEVASGEFGVTFDDGRFDDVTLEVVLPPGTYWIEFSSTSPGVGAYYNDLSTAPGDEYAADPDFLIEDVPVQPLTVQYRLCLQIQGQDPNNVVTAPGMYNLTGERYALLRCPEIEENSYRSLAYSKYHLGIAKFRTIYSPTSAYSENETPTARLLEHAVREFHPIGKLSKITLRFERQNGELYDFKGVNHAITFAVKYLEPARKAPWTDYKLNSNYQADFMKYMYSQQDREGSSSEEEDPYSRDGWRAKYKLHEDQYKYDSMSMQDRQKKIMQALDESESEEESDE